MVIVIPQEAHVLLAYKKGKALFAFFFLSQNPCGSSPCQKNSTCQAGFTSKGYRCVCPQGLGGENCDQGILLLIHQVMQIFPPFYTSSDANIPAFLYFLVFLFFFASENFRSSLKLLTSCLNMLVVYNEEPPSHFLASICLHHNYLRFSMASPSCGLRNH